MPIRRDLLPEHRLSKPRLALRLSKARLALKGLKWTVLDGCHPKIDIECSAGAFRFSQARAKLFIGFLIDNGCEVSGYWKKKSYRYLDPRIKPGERV